MNIIRIGKPKNVISINTEKYNQQIVKLIKPTNASVNMLYHTY